MRLHLRVIALVGLIVPRRLRRDWRQEWEAELRHRGALLADWDRLDWSHKLDLVRRSGGACRDALWLQHKRLEAEVIQDLRYGVRMLLAHPGFAAVAVLTLGLGIGANSAIFSLLDKVLIRALPVERPQQLVRVVSDAGGTPSIASYPLYRHLRDHNDVLSGLLAYFQARFSLSDDAGSEHATGLIVTGNYFEVLGVRPALGRFFLPEEDRTPGTHAVAVIGHGLWRRRFAADPQIVGRTLTANAYRYTIIGVTPPEFRGTSIGTHADLYLPVMMQVQALPGAPSSLDRPNWGWLHLLGRLKPGVTREQAQERLLALADQASTAPPPPGPKGRSGSRLQLLDGSRGHTDRVADLTVPLQLLMAVVGCVLLIACANIANLLLARGSARRKEISVRLAIGASPLRMVRQLLTESLLLAVLAGGAGLLVAYWLTGFLLGFEQPMVFLPRTLDAGIDFRVLAFTSAVSVLTAVLFTLAPARQAAKTDVVAALRADSSTQGGWTRGVNLRHLLVVAQVALSLVVLIGAGLFVQSLRRLDAVDPGFEPSKVVTATFHLSMNGYDEPRGRRFLEDLTARVSALPGVESAAFANIVALSELFWISGASIDGYQPQPGERMPFDFNAIGPGYFRTIGTPLVSGREFTPHDAAGAPRVVMVNEAAATRYWAGRDPVGRRTSRGEVVGVVKNSREKGLTVDPRPAIYLPLLQDYEPDLTVHVRTAIDPEVMAGAIRTTIQSVDPTLPVHNLRTLEQQKAGSLHTERLAATLLTIFGLVASILAAVGIYGVLSYAVTERTREMGIRLAQGAQPRDLLLLVVTQGMRLAAAGLVVGLAASFAVTRLIQRLLFGVSATDPLTFVVIPCGLAVVALLACWIPARRATRMSPLAALRAE